MKPELSEKLFVEDLFYHSKKSGKITLKSNDYEVDKLTGDASTRRYYRVSGSADSYVVCLDQPQGEEMGSEPPFMQVHSAFEKYNVRVPKIHDHEYDKGYFLEEDLGDQTLLSKLGRNASKDEEFGLYSQAVDELLKIHEIPKENFKECDFTRLAFDEKKLMSEVETTIKFLIKRYLAPSVAESQVERIRDGFKEICKSLATGKKVICHRDYHSRNIMVPKKDDFVIIDFQDARLGAPQYDLCSLLEDCYYRIESENKEKLFQRYWEGSRVSKDIYPSIDKFHEDYILSSSQRLFKALGSFAYIYYKRDDIRYLKYISCGFENLKEKLSLLPKQKDLLTVLSEIYYDS